MRERILFYHLHEPFGELSNFARFPIEIDGSQWPTSEHYFQAMKFPHLPDLQERIRETRRASEARRLAWQPGVTLRADWDTARDRVMLTVLRAKFRQHPSLAALLLSTAGAELVEHTANDRYWADGGDGTGRNRLGELLMQVRDELANAAPSDEPLS